MGRLHQVNWVMCGFPVTHFGGDNVKEARYGSDRPHGEQTDTCNTVRKLGDSFPEVLVAETVQRKETRQKDYKSILKDYKNILSVKKKGQDFSYASPRVTDKDSGIWDDTLGEKCHGRCDTLYTYEAKI